MAVLLGQPLQSGIGRTSHSVVIYRYVLVARQETTRFSNLDKMERKKKNDRMSVCLQSLFIFMVLVFHIEIALITLLGRCHPQSPIR